MNNEQKMVFDFVNKMTKGCHGKNPSNDKEEEGTILSPTAEKLRNVLSGVKESNNREILSKLLSIVVDENIELEPDNEEELQVSLYSLIVSLVDIDDECNTISRDEKLMIFYKHPNIEGVPRLINLDKFIVLVNEGGYVYKTLSNIKANEFRFATEDEIGDYVKSYKPELLKVVFDLVFDINRFHLDRDGNAKRKRDS